MTVEYPVYVHRGDDRHAHGITLSDFPGCFSAADHWRDIPAKVQQAVEVYRLGDDAELPPPGDIDRLRDKPEYQGGEWMFVAVTLEKTGQSRRQGR